jgi:5-methylcytosine-specific restriction enzyme A
MVAPQMNRPAQVCPTCKQLNCTTHSRHKRSDQYRSPAHERGYDGAWHKVRNVKISMDPLCEVCKAERKVTVAEEVHHEYPVATHPHLRLVLGNLWSLCRMHHRLVENGAIQLPRRVAA